MANLEIESDFSYLMKYSGTKGLTPTLHTIFQKLDTRRKPKPGHERPLVVNFSLKTLRKIEAILKRRSSNREQIKDDGYVHEDRCELVVLGLILEGRALTLEQMQKTTGYCTDTIQERIARVRQLVAST